MLEYVRYLVFGALGQVTIERKEEHGGNRSLCISTFCRLTVPLLVYTSVNVHVCVCKFACLYICVDEFVCLCVIVYVCVILV